MTVRRESTQSLDCFQPLSQSKKGNGKTRSGSRMVAGDKGPNSGNSMVTSCMYLVTLQIEQCILEPHFTISQFWQQRKREFKEEYLLLSMSLMSSATFLRLGSSRSSKVLPVRIFHNELTIEMLTVLLSSEGRPAATSLRNNAHRRLKITSCCKITFTSVETVPKRSERYYFNISVSSALTLTLRLCNN